MVLCLYLTSPEKNKTALNFLNVLKNAFSMHFPPKCLTMHWSVRIALKRAVCSDRFFHIPPTRKEQIRWKHKEIYTQPNYTFSMVFTKEILKRREVRNIILKKQCKQKPMLRCLSHAPWWRCCHVCDHLVVHSVYANEMMRKGNKQQIIK